MRLPKGGDSTPASHAFGAYPERTAPRNAAPGTARSFTYNVDSFALFQLKDPANQKAQQAQQGSKDAQQRATKTQQQMAQESQRATQQESQMRQQTQQREGQVASSATAGSPQQGGKSLDGKLTKVSKDELTLETSGGQSEKLKVNDSTKVTVDGQQKSIGELQQGAQVRAAYDERDGDKTATKIEAKDAKGGSTGSMKTGDSTKAEKRESTTK